MNWSFILVSTSFSLCFFLIHLFNKRQQRARIIRILAREIENKNERKDERGKTKKNLVRYYPFLGAFVGFASSFCFGKETGLNSLIAAFTGYGLVRLVSRIVRENKMQRRKEEVEFFLPIFMEQIVMGVQAGLDVVPAIKEALQGGAAGSGKLRELLQETILLSERGIPFTQALDQVSLKIDIPAVRHAFIHLKLAFSQGGELVRPLRELSDATQLQYQESVEEEIAKLPVKAVMPLVLTFAGLMICFLTVPIVQLSSIMKKVTPQEISR